MYIYLYYIFIFLLYNIFIFYLYNIFKLITVYDKKYNNIK